ncbi:glycerophosphodiester phosphodiesterase family protein [Flavobacteriales bacterium]|nr:glycerophosphodiester phosphodiesterase family protein [Flavobacteriales bacterium]
MKFVIKSFLFISVIMLLIAFVNFNDEPLHYDKEYQEKIIFAHRGIPQIAENSWQGFVQAKVLGFESIETDVQFTKDRKLVIFHDKNAKRLLGINKNINELNWEEIKEITLIHEGINSSQRILMLEDVLRQASDFEYIYLDIKVSHKAIADSLLVLLDKYQAYDNVLVADANILFLAYLKLKKPNVKTVLEGFNKGKEWTYYLIPQAIEPNYLASFYSEVDQSHIEFLEEEKLLYRKIIYGIDKSNFLKAQHQGLKHLIVDYHPTLDDFLNN